MPDKLPKNKPLTDAQRRTIFDLCRKVKKGGLDDEERRALQREVTGKASLKKFTVGDGIKFIDHLVGKLGAPKPAAPKKRPLRPQGLPDNVVYFITQKQRKKIEIMAGQVDWNIENGFELWMRSKFKFRYPKTNKQVDMVIHGLKSLQAQQGRKHQRAIYD